MKKRILFLSLITVLLMAGCSNLITDLGKMKGGVKYTVNHLLQNLDAISENDYTLEKSEELYGLPGETTKAEWKDFKGFSLAKGFEIHQQEIAEDGSTEINIKYDRNEYTIQFDPDGGLWNYDQAKENPSVPKLSDTVKVTGRYGAIVKDNEDYPDFSKLKKKGCIFIGWKKNGSDKVLTTEELEAKLPETFDVQSEDIIYTAQWEINGTKYIVRHLTENLDESGYSLSKEVELAGDAEDMTEAVPIDIEGFIKPEESSVVQKEITDDADNPTVVEIKYKRASYNVVIDLNGGYWNYSANKRNPGITLDGEAKTYSVKYGASFTLADYITSDIGKQSMKIDGWFKDGDTTVSIATEEAVISEMPSKNIEYKVVWIRNEVGYTLEYWLENANDTNSTKSRSESVDGLAETQTTISVEDLDDIEGFSKPVSIINREISPDGSTVVKVEYKRIRSTLTLESNGGYWNYNSYKENPSSVKPDVTAKAISVKFGGTIVYPAELTSLGMKGSELIGWKINETDKVVNQLPVVFDKTESVTYTAVWAEKKAKYKVEYYLQNIDGTDFVLSEKDTVELEDSAEKPSKVSVTPVDGYYVIKEIPGFTKPEKVTNKEINPDGSTVIAVNYTRNTYQITFNLDDGLWNYAAYKADPAGVTPDTKSKIINVKYGAEISYPSFADVNKRSYEFKGWETDSGNLVSTASLPVTQVMTKNVTYTASWIKLSNVAYKVEYYFENTNSTNAELSANYSINNSYTNNKFGVAEMVTEAEALPVSGFTAKTIEQEEINRDGSTVVKVYYKRNIININLDLNGGYWDYNKDSRTGTDNVIKTISGKYGTNVNYESVLFTGIGRRSYDFKGWVKTGTAALVASNALITTFPEADVTYTASWENIGNVAYKVEYWFEKTNAAGTTQNSTNYEQKTADYPTETLYGVEGDPTDATAKTVEGFTAANISQSTINRNGSTVVKIYYTRNTSSIILKVNGGKWSGGSSTDKTYTGKYGKALTETIPEPVRSGWAFGGWNEYQGTVNKTFGSSDVTYTAYWIPSVTVSPSFDGDIGMSVNTVSGVTTGTVTLPSGYDSSDCNFRWYVDGTFATDEASLSQKLANGIHTVTVKVTINGVVYTKQATVSK